MTIAIGSGSGIYTLNPQSQPLPQKNVISTSCFNFQFSLDSTPFTTPVTPSQFPPEELNQLPLHEGPHWIFSDGEPDDYAHFLMDSDNIQKGNTQIIAEPHKKEGVDGRNTFAGIRKALHAFHLLESSLLAGSQQPGTKEKAISQATLASLIERLKTLPDHSLCISLIAGSAQFAALAEKEPDLLAKKIKRIVALGGFAYRHPKDDKNQEKVYYTTHNLTTDLDAARVLFRFAEEKQVPTYILSTDQLRLERTVNRSLCVKLEHMAANGFEPAQALLAQIDAWNEKTSHKRQHQERDMTPADLIAAQFQLSFDHLQIDSQGISHLQITEEPRYEKAADDSYQPTNNRKVDLQTDDSSSLRYVKGFRLGFSLSPTQTFEGITNYILNRVWHHQTNNPKQPLGASMSVPNTTNSLASSMTGSLPPSTHPATPAPNAAVTHAATQSNPAALAQNLQQPAQALPKNIPIAQIVSETHKDILPSLASQQRIADCVQSKDYFGLRDLFQSHVVAEYQTGSYKETLRDSFRDAFTALKKAIKISDEAKKVIQENIKKHEGGAKLSPAEAKEVELYFFTNEGRGAETVRIYSPILLPYGIAVPTSNLFPTGFSGFTSDYKDAILQWAKGNFFVRHLQRVIGTEKPLNSAESFKDPKKPKANISVDGSLVLAGRKQILETQKQEELKALREISASLLPAIQKAIPEMRIAPNSRVAVFERGMIGAGKSTIGKQFFDLDDSQLPNSDRTKKLPQFGDLAHHELAALWDVIREEAAKDPSIPCSIDARTNTTNDNSKNIGEVKPNLHKVVFDIVTHDEAITRDRLAQRAQQGKARLPSEQEIVQGFKDSSENRASLIEATKTNEALTVALIDNYGKEAVIAAVITGQKLYVRDEALLAKMRANDAHLDAALKTIALAANSVAAMPVDA